MDHAGVVIVGAGAAGAVAASTLRHAYDGRIVVVRGEAAPPYNRTTVNKALLEGTLTMDDVVLPDADSPAVEWTGPDLAASLDAAARTVMLRSGRSLRYDHLIVATGAVPRPFAGLIDAAARDRVLTLRSAADADRLRAWIRPGARLTIVGAGLIGAETASLMAAAGVTVRLVSRTTTPMSDQLGRTVAAYLRTLHEEHVETHFGHTVEAIAITDRGHVTATLTEGAQLDSDVVMASLGVRPDVDWLAGAGLDLSDGVATDDRLRARGAANLYAAGDVARVTDADGAGYRIEHWNHAVAHGRHAARALLYDIGLSDDPGPFDELSTSSTRLYGRRVTVVGHPRDFSGETLVDGDPAAGRFTVALTDDNGKLVGAVGVGGGRTANALANAVHTNAPLVSGLEGATPAG